MYKRRKLASQPKSISRKADEVIVRLPDSTNPFSLLNSKCNTFDVRSNPCSLATAAAAAHNGFGIGDRP